MLSLILLQRSQQIERSHHTGFKRGCVLTEEELESIRADIKDMVTPSWLPSIPANLGECSHGKLKADQWRTLGTTYLPSSLIRLWHKVEADDERSI